MKFIKFLIIALLLSCSMQLAKAQVSVGLHIGYHEPYRRVYPAYVYYPQRYYSPPVYYNRPVYYPVHHRGFYHSGYYGRPVYHGRFYRHGRRW